MKNKKYDFAGYVTKNDLKCLDGLVIKQDAFAHQDNASVPLVWQHSHDSLENVLGHMILENRKDGVYGYGYLNKTDMGVKAKELIRHGDINSMSIWANGLKRRANDVLHGVIREISLVLAGANPGAKIDFVSLEHGASDENSLEALIWTDTIIHSSDVLDELLNAEYEVDEELDELEDENEIDEDTVVEHSAGKPTVKEVMSTMTELQQNAVATLIEALIEENDSVGHSATEEDNPLKTNLFNNEDNTSQATTINELQHSVFSTMYNDKLSLKEALEAHKDEFIEHGIINMELLFPEAQYVGDKPYVYADQNTAYEHILGKVKKVPFARLKNLIADFTADDARALGYKKGDKKIDQVFKLYGRETYPQTVYKKQSYDRDDVIDITEIDLINFTKAEMRMMLNRELARAILVGDGRATGSANKINQDKIRPVITDDEFYTIKKTYTGVADIIEAVITAMADYRGNGTPDLYMHPTLIAKLRLLKAVDGRYLFGDIPSAQSIAARLGVNSVVPTTFLAEDAFLVTNLADYSLGANQGGQVTTFDDFDIDFNKLKYLIETRVSGSLMVPKSAIYFTLTTVPAPPVGG